MKQRILTALVLTPIAVAVILLLPTYAFAGLTALVWLLALWEWTRLIGIVPMPARIVTVAAGAVGLGALWWLRDTPAWWFVIGAGLVWWLLVLAWLRNFSFGASPTPRNHALKIVAGFAMLLPSWAALIEIHRVEPLGHNWALFALVLVWVADSFAYFAGRRFGKNKLAPRISPGKTVEGVIGAFAGSAVVAVIGGWLLDERGLALALLLVVAALTLVFSVVGDLFESLIKRQSNVKDSGALFPGHGGLLDRLDSVFAAMPVFVAGKALIDLALRA